MSGIGVRIPGPGCRVEGSGKKCITFPRNGCTFCCSFPPPDSIQLSCRQNNAPAATAAAFCVPRVYECDRGMCSPRFHKHIFSPSQSSQVIESWEVFQGDHKKSIPICCGSRYLRNSFFFSSHWAPCPALYTHSPLALRVRHDTQQLKRTRFHD